MKLINHIMFVDINDDKKLMINSLNGKINEINAATHETLLEWRSCADISPRDINETKLLDSLQDGGYIVDSEDEERAKKNAILDALRKRNIADKENTRVMTFIMTYDCNFRCPYCFEEHARFKEEVITRDLIDAALDLTNESLELIGLFGGEPLLPKTKSAIEHLISKVPDKKFEIFTNGYYLEEFSELLSTVEIFRITVTLDGNEETHNSRRFLEGGGSTYQKILNGISACLCRGIPIRIRVNVDQDNLDEAYLQQEHLLDMFNRNDLLDFEMAPLFGCTNKTRNSILSDMYKRNTKLPHEDRVRGNSLANTSNPIINALTGAQAVSPLYSYCAAHENKLAVDPYGNIYTCLVTVGIDDLAIGKYYPEVRFKENSIYNRNIDAIPECRECIYSLLCGGGCPLKLQDSSDWFRPACEIVKTQIHDLLPMLYETKQETNS